MIISRQLIKVLVIIVVGFPTNYDVMGKAVSVAIFRVFCALYFACKFIVSVQ